MSKKIVLPVLILSSIYTYADYKIIISNKNEDYKIETAWSDWTNVGSEYDCTTAQPLISEVDKGLSFDQNYECSQDQERSTNINTERRTILISKTNTGLVGTKVYNSCLGWLNAGYSTNGNYAINPTGNEEFDAYCDMTTSGGGWTLVFYSNSDNVPRSSVSNSDWNTSNTINFSRLYSFKDIKRNGKYEFFVHDSSTTFRHTIFSQTNAYNENPIGNSYTKIGGNMYYSDRTTSSRWFGLALGNYGQTAMVNNCTLSMADYGSSWTYCLQDQLTGSYGTGPWFYDGGYDSGSQQWVKIYQR